MLDHYKQLLETANVSLVSKKTPLDKLSQLSLRCNNSIYLKREDLQSIFSFKCRGAFNRINHLSQAEKEKGIIAASAGNHAQGVALAAQKLKLNAIIVMPTTTPSIKVNTVKRLGANVILYGDSFDDACEHALKIKEKQDMTFIHPYDDPYVIAGQGTIGIELMNQLDSIDSIYAPVGGGGLLAGLVASIKTIKPSISIIGVEPDNSNCLEVAMKANKRVILDRVGIFADGVAVKQIGKHNFELIKPHIEKVITVSIDEICAAIKDIFDETRSITEPAGALALAGLKKDIEKRKLKNKTLVTINSGANTNFDRLRHIAERADIGEEKEALFAVTIPEQPGSFKEFCNLIGKQSITEFNYRLSDPINAHIFVGIELKKGKKEASNIFNLIKKHFKIENLTDNELAKIHIRHMVGGRNNSIKNERLFRFQFPERPGALMEFLNGLGSHWNISLFHYRNHGAAYGRVLVGLEVPDHEAKSLVTYLTNIGFWFKDETNNPAFKHFL